MILTILIKLPRYGPDQPGHPHCDHPDHPHCDHDHHDHPRCDQNIPHDPSDPDDPQSNGEPGKLQRVLRAATSRRRVSFWVEILAGGIIHIMHKVISSILAGGIIPNVHVYYVTSHILYDTVSDVVDM